MKVLFYVYPHAFQAPGGGEVMLLKTKEALEKKGITVRLFNQWDDKLKEYDILHVFGSVKDCLGLMESAKHARIKVALSPIYWSTLQRSLHEYGTLFSKTQMVARHMLKVVLPCAPSARRTMMRIADILLPNSEAEARQVSRLFAIERKKMHVAPLGADERFLKAKKDEFIAQYGIRDFVLSVGRIEPRKNQLNLIRALKGTGLRLVCIGSPVPGYEAYYDNCVRSAAQDTLFIERVPQESSLLASAYAACKVFVLQGWFETPGLVALEAGLAGAKLAVTTGGSTREYFKDYVQYLDPACPESIRRAVMAACAQDNTGKLTQHIKEHFLWSFSAQETIAAYERVLA